MAEIKHQIPINASPDNVYAAIATQNGLRSWWTADSITDSQVGGKAEFGFDKRGTVFRMKIAEIEPSRRLVWKCHGDDPEWTGTTLTWEVSARGNGAVLRFTHSGWKEINDYCSMCNSTWGELMYRLKDYIEGKNPGPHWKE